MKLACPHCGDSFAFDPSLAGKTFACGYCKRPVTMPSVEQLQPDDREAYLADVQKEKERAEKQRQKEEAARQAQARQEALDRKRAEERRRHAEAQRKQEESAAAAARQRAQQQAQWEARVRESQQPVPEESAVSNRFPALLAIATVAKVVTVIAVVFCVGVAALTLFGGLLGGGGATVLGIVVAGAWGLFAAVAWVIGWSYAEMIMMAIDVANDIRATRLLTKHLAYHPDHHQAPATLQEVITAEGSD